MAAFIPIAAALIGGIGSMLKNKAKHSQAKEEASLAHDAAVRGWDQREQGRIALLRTLQGTGGTSGPKVAALLQGLDPSMFQARPYAGPATGTQTGNSTLGDILSGLGSAGAAAGDYYTQKSASAKNASEQQKLLCAVYPSMPDCPSQSIGITNQGD